MRYFHLQDNQPNLLGQSIASLLFERGLCPDGLNFLASPAPPLVEVNQFAKSVQGLNSHRWIFVFFFYKRSPPLGTLPSRPDVLAITVRQ